ncbi:a0c9bbaa-f6b0-4eaf-8189-a591bee59169 [Thermothielavioides terrestris]|uniref:A0c9bbaa-f6b0-4eaf-8189-a591bee59169 n=1 Tax=Thermothielavioides terrestris TaxID=2587410 RepID=A0A3S4AT77_9PEZI|nr:a0c9bbaa-f6b0-4eaf-8189-a591bee59169 [Thermothielavioides terrestris]
MARSALPVFPLVVFGVLEPALLIWAYLAGMRDPHSYFAAQIPGASVSTTDFSPQALGVTLQLLNVLLLLAPVAVVCSFSRDPATVKGYLFAVALADYGHVYATYRALGVDAFLDPSQWNDMVWGAVAASGVLNILRWLTLLGVFGPVTARAAGEGKPKRN